MKIKTTIQILAVTILLTACNKTTSDSDIRQKIVGAWTPVSSSGHSRAADTEMRSDGSYTLKWNSDTNVLVQGNWNVKDGIVTFTNTNIVGAGRTNFAAIQHYKIVRIESREMVFCSSDYSANPTTFERK